MRRARTTAPSSLTSLLDVLFILMFAALVQASARSPAEAGAPAGSDGDGDGAEDSDGGSDGDRTATTADAGVDAPPAGPAELDALRRAALDALARELEGAPTVIARISPDGALTAVELADRRLPLGVPLVERVADPDVGLAYLGDRAAELRLCRTVARQLGEADLTGRLVIIAPDVAVRDLPYALVNGLARDAARCRTEQGATAVVVEPPPGATPPTLPRGTP